MAGISTQDLPVAKRGAGKLMFVPVGFLLSIALSFGYLALTATPRPSIPLGASSLYPGGMARISAIAPLENDGWLPPERGEALDQEPAAGNHRVRLLVELTALEAAGLVFSSPDFAVTGIGSGPVQPIWSSVESAKVSQGRILEATLVFELPNQAIALALEGPDGTRLSLGQAHHGK